MARRLVYIVLAIIALQLSWVAMSAYCAHETGSAAQHFGHHQHVENTDEVPLSLKDKPASAKKFAAHTHCSSCSHAVLAIGVLDTMAHPFSARLAPDSVVVEFSSIASTPPERPQWTTAA